MDRTAIIHEMDKLTQRARERMMSFPHSAEMSYAEISWLIDDELTEFIRLRSLLPSFYQERIDAKKRIEMKIKNRKYNQ